MLATILHHPRKLLLRRVLFQIHLWVGILLALYVIVISLSGSILVFQNEIRRASLQQPRPDPVRVASIDTVVARARQSFPAQRLTFVGVPQEDTPWWTLYLSDAQGKPDLAYADTATGKPLSLPHRLFIDVVLDLHVYLLAGHTGFVVNCTAGIGLLLLALTGAVLWWPGIKLWKRALTVAFQRGWKRTNYDLHNAIGIWTLLIVSWWSITAVYFLWPTQVSRVVSTVSPLVGMKAPPAPKLPPSIASVPSLDAILAGLPLKEPERLSGVTLPAEPGGLVTVYVDRRRPGDFSHRDIFTVDGHTGSLLTVWHYGENHSLGDWFLWLMYPLHFGTVWGVGAKVLWSLLGLGLAALSVTGVLMYWNRKLSKWFAKAPSPGKPEV